MSKRQPKKVRFTSNGKAGVPFSSLATDSVTQFVARFEATAMLEPGQQAPSFELPNHAGETVSLDNFDGRVVVYFYPRADTAGCTTEACGFRDSWEAFEKRGVPVLGISDDPISDLDKFREKHDLPFELLSDESGEVANAYDSYGEKNMFGNTFDGVFRNTFVVGSDGTIEHVFEDVSPDGHATEILSTLE